MEEVALYQTYKINAESFSKKNPEKCIKKLSVNHSEEIEVIEHAPLLFSLVRRGLKSEQEIMNSLIPSLNFEAIHNFETGQGKSPSFFFFSDDHTLMLKTLQASEVRILLKTDFLVNYVMHLVRNPDSILSRYFGVYEVRIME